MTLPEKRIDPNTCGMPQPAGAGRAEERADGSARGGTASWAMVREVGCLKLWARQAAAPVGSAPCPLTSFRLRHEQRLRHGDRDGVHGRVGRLRLGERDLHVQHAPPEISTRYEEIIKHVCKKIVADPELAANGIPWRPCPSRI